MKKENRGGKRAGAGRPKQPPKEYSEKFKKALRKALEKKQKENNGKTIHDILVDLLYNEENQDAVRLGAYKQIKEVFINKETSPTIIGTQNLAVVMLPPMMEPPKEVEDKTIIEAEVEKEE